MRARALVLVCGVVLASVLGAASTTASAATIGAWSFDADFSDSSGLGNHLNAYGTPTTLEPGLFGNAASFDGSNFLWSPSASLTADRGQFSLGTWIQAVGNPGPDAVVLGNFFQYGQGLVYRAGITDHFGRAYAYVNRGNNHAYSPPSILNDGSWHHVAQTFDGSTIRLYVDGLQVGSASSAEGSTGTAAEFSVGGRSTGNFFTGLVDEAFFRDDVASASEIASLAQPPAVPEPTALLILLLAGGAGLAVGGSRKH